MRAGEMSTARTVELIGVASGLGGADAGCARAPARLAAGGLESWLRHRGVRAFWGETLMPRRGAGGLRRAVARLCSALARRVAASLREGRFPCVIGGDHSCAAGTWGGAATALHAHGRMGLVWIDAHMDSHVPDTSPSGRLHGMPLAALLGRGERALDWLGGGALDPRRVALVGVRSFEREEAHLLENLGVRVFDIDTVGRRGLTAVMHDAIAIAREGSPAYGATLDLDAVDPREAPAVATPAQCGLRADELVAALAPLAADPRFAAFEVAEYCPRLDRDGRSERLLQRLLGAALGGNDLYRNKDEPAVGQPVTSW